jgi:hypothetical protein
MTVMRCIDSPGDSNASGCSMSATATMGRGDRKTLAAVIATRRSDQQAQKRRIHAQNEWPNFSPVVDPIGRDRRPASPRDVVIPTQHRNDSGRATVASS